MLFGREGKKKVILMLLIVAVIFLAVMFVNRASVGRWMKDVKSEWNNGLNRTISVYDVNGGLIREYSGKFDIEWSNDHLKFDDENGKRHLIYFKTGTICVDEN